MKIEYIKKLVCEIVILDDGNKGGTDWTAFYAKDNDSYYFDQF